MVFLLSMFYIGGGIVAERKEKTVSFFKKRFYLFGITTVILYWRRNCRRA
jgi:hypothetical protein